MKVFINRILIEGLMEITLVKLIIQSMLMVGRHLDHTEEDHLLQEVTVCMEEPKYSLPIHSNGNTKLIIPGLILINTAEGEFNFKFSNSRMKPSIGGATLDYNL